MIRRTLFAATALLCTLPALAPAACDTCATFAQGISWGTITANGLTEASGIVASRRNPGVLWAHNDGSRERIFAFSTNGTYLAGFSLNTTAEDLEDIAAGPGPVPGVSYLYIGDIGASSAPNLERIELRVFRIPEPAVEHAWAANPVTENFDSVETIILRYPDGGHDAEALMFDSRTGDVFVIIKHPAFARVYRANLASATDGSIVVLQFERQISFAAVSAADLSADGSRIIIRREDFAMTWARCTGETLGEALARTGLSVPVSSAELNGEGITLLPDDTGYVTISEGAAATLYFFQSQCPVAPQFIRGLTNLVVTAGGSITLNATAVGYPPPQYSWRFNGTLLNGQTSSSLLLANLSAANQGTYEITASNSLGTVTSTATLTVSAKPDLRITEVQSSTAPSPNLPTEDWWELTSFETQPVSLAGWRFNDNSGGLTDPFTLPQGLTINPGESIVFVEILDPAQFRAWWGSNNLPANLKIITYSGAGLSFGNGGDGVRLWSNSAASASDTVASVDFGAAVNGVTFTYNPATTQFGAVSQVGVNGAFQAANAPDIGSPGRIYGPLEQPQLRVSRNGDLVRIQFNALAGATYELQARTDLASGHWLATGQSARVTANAPLSLEVPANAARLFYRVVGHR